LTSSRLEVAEYALRGPEGKQKEMNMNSEGQTDCKGPTKGGPLPGLLRPPIIFLFAILLGIALKLAWSPPFIPSNIRLLGPVLSFCAVVLFLLSYREFRSAGTSVRGSERSTTIVRTGPYRFSRNPIYLSFIVLVVGLSIWLNDFWLIVVGSRNSEPLIPEILSRSDLAGKTSSKFR
jgi:hypothetical protein